MADQDIVHGYAEGLFRVLQSEDQLDRVEDELYNFGKILDSSHELKQALADSSLSTADRVRILEELLGGRVSPSTLGLLTFIVAQDRARQLPQILSELSGLAAEAKKRVIAEVRSAVPLDDEQRQRLSRVLGDATGKQVELKVLVDPSVLGGIYAKVGDTVIDGSVRRRLEQLKEQVRG